MLVCQKTVGCARASCPRPDVLLRTSRVVRRAGDGPGGMPASMTLEKAYDILGVKPGASFEQVLQAKQKLLSSTDGEKAMDVECAYDLLLMQSMKKRLTGELEVSTSVRYADVPVTPKKSSAFARGAAAPKGSDNKGMPSLPKLSAPTGLGVAVVQPRNKQVLATQSAVFASLAAWALLQAVLEPDIAQLSDTAGLQLSLALIYSIYTLKENKGMQIGKAVCVTVGALVAGGLVGNLVEAWLRVDIVPIMGFSSPGVLVGEWIIAALAAGAIFLV